MRQLWCVVALVCGLQAVMVGQDVRALRVTPPQPVELLAVPVEHVQCSFLGFPRLVRWNNAYVDDGTSTDLDAVPVSFGSPGSQLLQGFGIVDVGTVVDAEIDGADKLIVQCNRGLRSVRLTGMGLNDVALLTLSAHTTNPFAPSIVYEVGWTGVPDPTIWLALEHVGHYQRLTIQARQGAFVVHGVSLP